MNETWTTKEVSRFQQENLVVSKSNILDRPVSNSGGGAPTSAGPNHAPSSASASSTSRPAQEVDVRKLTVSGCANVMLLHGLESFKMISSSSQMAVMEEVHNQTTELMSKQKDRVEDLSAEIRKLKVMSFKGVIISWSIRFIFSSGHDCQTRVSHSYPGEQEQGA